MSAYYFYRMTTDNGGAPCCVQGFWSLAICKPQIRSTAGQGDYVIGFAGQEIDPGNGIIHVARITSKERDGSYYDPDSAFRSRHCIYERVGNRYTQRRNPFHGPAEMDRDLGADRSNTHILVSEEFRYFGRNRLAVDWSQHAELRTVLDNLTQGHRVNHSASVRRSLEELIATAMKSSTKTVSGRPTHTKPSRCNVDDDAGDCRC